MASWLAVGSPENWETSFNYGNTWGLRQTQKGYWDQLSEDDLIFFYATSPVKRVIGYGKISSKFKQDRPLWPEELRKNIVIWPLRFQFDISSRFGKEEWGASGITHPDLKYRVRSGFQSLSNEISNALVEDLNSSYRKKSAIIGTSFVSEKGETPKYNSLHDELKEKLLIIGGVQKFIAEKEFKVDGKRLDVTWRRVERGVPTYAFEVQIGGNITDALAKLKHAFDLWNSKLYLVAKSSEKEKVDTLLEGTFHEIRNSLKFITEEEVKKLYESKIKLHKLEGEIGIL
ncbi:MAG: hypothetical protein ACW963_10395 [Candidatus Sifarchaeia archaeon]